MIGADNLDSSTLQELVTLAANRTYDELLTEVMRLQDEGKLPTHVTRDQAISWVYGNMKIENERTTVEMATKAVDANSIFQTRR